MMWRKSFSTNGLRGTDAERGWPSLLRPLAARFLALVDATVTTAGSAALSPRIIGQRARVCSGLCKRVARGVWIGVLRREAPPRQPVEGTPWRARGLPMDCGDKPAAAKWSLFTPPLWSLFAPPLTNTQTKKETIMKKMLSFLGVVVILLVVTVSFKTAFAQDYTYTAPEGVAILTEDELRETLSGNTVYYSKAAEYYYPDGGIKAKNLKAGFNYSGRWSIKGPVICFDYEEDKYDNCQTVSRGEEEKLLFYAAKTGELKFEGQWYKGRKYI